MQFRGEVAGESKVLLVSVYTCSGAALRRVTYRAPHIFGGFRSEKRQLLRCLFSGYWRCAAGGRPGAKTTR